MSKEFAEFIMVASATASTVRAARTVIDLAQNEDSPECVPGYWIPREAIETLRYTLKEIDKLP